MTTMLEVRDVSVSFGGPPVLDHVSLAAAEGEIVSLLGPSGSGKSTLLRVIAGLVVPDTGAVLLDGRDVTSVPTYRRGIGMVFQDEQLFPHRDVRGNIAFGLQMQRQPVGVIDRRVAELLELVGLGGFEQRDVASLSGGEAKRVALARSLAPAPRAVLLDEPLTGLDRELHDRLAVDVGRILRAAGTTAVLVTHDHDEAAAIADRVVRLPELRALSIVEVAPEDTHDLRRRVLRDGRLDATVVFDGDGEEGTTQLGARDAGGRLVGVSTWLWCPCPVDPGRRDRQLRGMAVDPSRQGCGVGATLLAAGVDEAARLGATAVWANARDTALGFYRRHGFEVLGEGFVDETTGLPHHRIRIRFPFLPRHDTHGG
jgi:thiamine transport system ATP-binding protein